LGNIDRHVLAEQAAHNIDWALKGFSDAYWNNQVMPIVNLLAGSQSELT
jgi:hypothetical protein